VTGPSKVPLHLVEPTLESEAGHCHSFVRSVCAARREGDGPITVYAGARLPNLEGPGVRVVPYFRRRIRRLQSFFLYRRLLREPGRILVSTAGRSDMVLLSLAAGGTIPRAKVFLYLHWVHPTPSKRKFFRKVGARQPNLVLMGPTETVVDIFRASGFPDVRVLPYPITPVPSPGADAGAGFRHVLFAGAARRDKGFPKVVDLVCRMARDGARIPVAVQASPDHYGKYDGEIGSELRRLRDAAYPWLRTIPDTLGQEAYREMFEGAVVLQPYSREDFTDRISGVTLDALSAGAPVVATSGTWMARVAERFGAGVSLDDLAPEALLRAVEHIREAYPRFHRNALAAGRALQVEHGARRLLDAVLQAPGEGP
jgi:glycosyltransferase involved in cell wall biosynthesis